jgi:hypothetical protein
MDQSSVVVEKKRRPDVMLDNKRKFYGDRGWMYQYLNRTQYDETDAPDFDQLNHSIFDGGKVPKRHRE